MLDDQPTTLWTLLRDRRVITCHVRLEVHGIDVAIVHDGATIITRTFETDVEALGWAAHKRAEKEKAGWKPLLTPPAFSR